MSPYALAVTTFTNMLGMLSDLIDKGAAHARSQGRDPEALMSARLADDMYPLAAQVKIATDHARDTVAQLAGREAPEFETADKTLADLKSRIEKTIVFVAGVPQSAFAGAAERKIVIPIPAMKIEFHMTGEEFLRDWALANFYFHVVTAYDILRREGTPIGKRDFMPHVGKYIRPM